ncbi:unnamed protein product [Brassica napus]|uniref:(rape) hypothetical protein n=1 Tax=Brassica napus TaxID=3708 RepID=A0A816RA59_BRANA|nr:unnamed protein product [Brassica napus]
MTLLLGRPDSEKSTLLLALADKNLKLTEFAKPKPTELFRVSSVRPTTCLGEHQQTATCLKDLKAFAEAIDVVRDKGVAMAVAVAVAMAMASAEDIDATVHVQKFSEVKKAL